MLETFRRENARWNGCLGHREKSAGNNSEKLESCSGDTGQNIRKKRRHTIKNKIGGK